MKVTSLVLLNGIAALALLAGCSKPAAPAPEATTSTDSAAPATPAPVALPAKSQKSQRAEALLQFIDTRPECQQFRATLEQASAAPADQTVDLDLLALLDQAHKAGCQKNPR